MLELWKWFSVQRWLPAPHLESFAVTWRHLKITHKFEFYIRQSSWWCCTRNFKCEPIIVCCAISAAGAVISHSLARTHLTTVSWTTEVMWTDERKKIWISVERLGLHASRLQALNSKLIQPCILHRDWHIIQQKTVPWMWAWCRNN